jgi:hypothetical protein
MLEINALLKSPDLPTGLHQRFHEIDQNTASPPALDSLSEMDHLPERSSKLLQIFHILRDLLHRKCDGQSHNAPKGDPAIETHSWPGNDYLADVVGLNHLDLDRILIHGPHLMLSS